mmetsp:Transcript_42564/g.69894  ORF Transcript_42564/g.69894 Transcript_42564/m.69894 type:complete len:490 (-) Transcript_42564:307-1776(-)
MNNTLNYKSKGDAGLSCSQNWMGKQLESMSIGIEVAAVLDDLIQDLEVWEYANAVVYLNRKYEKVQSENNLFKDKIAKMTAQELFLKQKSKEQGELAKDLKKRFVHELLLVQEELKVKERLDQENKILSETASKVPYLEKEVNQLQKELYDLRELLKDSHKRASASSSAHDEIKHTGGGVKISPQPAIAVIPKLANLEEKILLKICSFLPGPDVIAAASTDKRLYLRVDALFAMGSRVQLSAPAPSPPPPPPPPRSRRGSGASPSPTGSAAPPAPVLNTAVAEAIAKKLSSNELKGIISLQQHIKKLSETVSVLHLEKEDLAARLKGAEDVKAFLLADLKGKEGALRAERARAAAAAAQHGADREVVAFLDARVHELESELATTQKNLSTCQAELNKEQETRKEKAAAVEQTLRYERAAAAEAEARHRAERRLLAAEVKKLRAEKQALRASRDALELQVEGHRRREASYHRDEEDRRRPAASAGRRGYP